MATDGALRLSSAGLSVRFTMRVLRSGDLRLAVPKRAAGRDLTPETLANHDLLSSPEQIS